MLYNIVVAVMATTILFRRSIMDNNCTTESTSSDRIQKPLPAFDPIEEEALEMLRSWLSNIYRSRKVDRYIVVKKTESYLLIISKMWTAVNEYTITASFPTLDARTSWPGSPPASYEVTEGYLSCTAGSRTNRPGETWPRGSDLADGRFTNETWEDIMIDIVRYEAQDVAADDWKKRYTGEQGYGKN
jgi:hypothetical protein